LIKERYLIKELLTYLLITFDSYVTALRSPYVVANSSVCRSVLKILTSPPATAASCERNFSKLKLQSPQHDVSQESLVGLFMISIEQELCRSLDT